MYLSLDSTLAVATPERQREGVGESEAATLPAQAFSLP